MSCDPTIYGEFPDTHSPAALGKALQRQGLNVRVDSHCVRFCDLGYFKLEVFDGAVSADADFDTVEEAIADVKLVSSALTSAKIRHRFTVLDDDDKEVAQFAYDYPSQD
ncbi:hypothetical protein NA78x_004698 [Anatilimnocola sp. NA78]|uniref:hypothetical protein n=1 Tax=Anatilimnocola sp. NA78 TaxID=3415683 RepID=UPI003CE4D3D3